LIAVPGTAGKLRLKLTVAPGAGASWTFEFVKNNGGAPEFSVTISNTATTGYGSSTFECASGDYLWIRAVPSVGPAPAATYLRWCWTWEPTTANQTILSGFCDGDVLPASGTRYLPFFGAFTTPLAVADYARLWLPIPGTISDMEIRLGTPPGVNRKSRIFQWRRDGILQASQKVTISGLSETGSDHTGSFSVNDDSYIDIRSITLGRGLPDSAPTTVSVAAVFTPDQPGYFLVGSNSQDELVTGNQQIEYRQFSTGGSATAWNATAETRRGVTHRVEMVRLRVHLTALPVSGSLSLVGTSYADGPLVKFASGDSLSKVSHRPHILAEGLFPAGYCLAISVPGDTLAQAAMCMALRVPRAEDAPWMF
jgi:hypothetical protein